MDVTAPGKLYALIAVICGAFAVIIVGMLTDTSDALVTSMVGLIGSTIGYLVGNATGARNGTVTVPPLSPSPQNERMRHRLVELIAEDLGQPHPEKE